MSGGLGGVDSGGVSSPLPAAIHPPSTPPFAPRCGAPPCGIIHLNGYTVCPWAEEGGQWDFYIAAYPKSLVCRASSGTEAAFPPPPPLTPSTVPFGTTHLV